MLKNIPKPFKRILFVIFTILLLYFGNSTVHKVVGFLNNVINNANTFNLALNISFNSTLPTLCVVTRIYQSQISYLPVLAFALYHTGLGNIRIYLINTDNRTDIHRVHQTIQFINDLILRKDFVTYLDLGEVPTKKDFGYEMTDRALRYLYKQFIHSPLLCQYVMFTNGDNFYSRNFARKLLPHMETQKDVITWSFISHHHKIQYQERIDHNKSRDQQIIDDGTEKCTPAILRIGATDLGAVAYRLAFLQKHNLTFSRSDRAHPSLYDGFFMHEAIKRTNATVLVKQTLFVHQ